MSQSLTLPVAGLMTDPGPFTAAPEGSLVEAQNVVVLRPGVIEPRQGNLWVVDTTLKAGGYSAQAVFSDPSDNTFVWALVGTTWILRRNPATITGPSTYTRGKIRVCPTGGRALFTSDAGICALPNQTASPTAGSSAIAYRAGLFQPFIPVVSLTSTGQIPNNTVVAYRFTVRRTLANGTIVESPPSRRLIASNTSGANAGFFFSGAITPTDVYQAFQTIDYNTNPYGDYAAGDLLCVWRAPSTTVPNVPSDEMTLRATIPWNATFGGFVDPANPPSPWRDDMPDGQWNGPALYTNETQEGAALANYRPEYARDIALYNGMTFYAGARSPHKVVLRNVACGTNDQNSSFTYRVADLILTTGSTLITGLSAAETRQIRVGQVITGNGQDPEALGVFPPRTQIVSIVPGVSLTVSAASTVTGPTSCAILDWIQVTTGSDQLRMYARTNSMLVPFLSPIATDFAASANDRAYANAEAAWMNKLTSVGSFGSVWRSIQLRVEGVAGYYEAAPGTGARDGIWTFSRTDSSQASFTVTSSCPEAWDKYVDPVTGITSQQDGSPAELRWSKVNEPEHCPLPYRTVVGDAAYAIRRIIPARNSLLILKDDGLYQCFGQTPDALSFELLDRTITLPAPATYDEQSKWVDRFDDRVVAMTTRGPMILSDTGGETIGAPILESLRRAFTSSFGALDDALRAMMIDITGRRVGFIWNVGTPETAVGYIVDMETGTWTYWTWRRPIGACTIRTSPSVAAAAVGVPTSALGYVGGYLAAIPYSDRTMLDDASVTLTTMPKTYEDVLAATCTINTVTGTGPYTVTIAAGSEWTPTVGDLLIRSGVSHEVVGVTSATVFTTDTQPTTGSATWREGYPVRVVWTARSEGNVGAEKHWFSAVFPFELTEAVNTMQSIFTGYRNPTAVTANAFETTSNGTSPWSLVPLYKRVAVPAAIARDWGVKVGFALTRAGSWFSTSGLSMQFSPIAPDKVSR